MPDAIASDLKNCLGAIRGTCELAKLKNPRNQALTRRMDAAMATSDEASSLIGQLLSAFREPTS